MGPHSISIGQKLPVPKGGQDEGGRGPGFHGVAAHPRCFVCLLCIFGRIKLNCLAKLDARQQRHLPRVAGIAHRVRADPFTKPALWGLLRAGAHRSTHLHHHGGCHVPERRTQGDLRVGLRVSVSQCNKMCAARRVYDKYVCIYCAQTHACTCMHTFSETA